MLSVFVRKLARPYDKLMWTDRDESKVTCDGALGAVGNGETVARLLVKMTPPSGWRPFNRSQFKRPEDKDFSNTCGNSDGCSVDRSNGLSQQELQQRSSAFAAASQLAAEARKPQTIIRTGGGALTAAVDTLRQIKAAGNFSRQTVYIYADPLASNCEHAVIRVRDGVPEEEWPILLDDITAAFS